MRKFRGWEKTRHPFSAVSGPKFTNSEACSGVPIDWQDFFRLLISCFVAEICSVSFKVGPKNVFLSSPWRGGVNARGSSGDFFQIAVMSEYMYTSLVEIRSVTS